MTDTPLFPKPKQLKTVPVAVRTAKDGREIVNLLCKAGRDEYVRRKRLMWERQGRFCCLYGFIPGCPGKLRWEDAMFAHEIPRGHGGGARDDRTEIDGKWLNGVAHPQCNSLAGSRRIKFNANRS